MRFFGRKTLFSFCVNHDIVIPETDKIYALGKSKYENLSGTYSHHLHVEIFSIAINLQLSELNNHFDEVNTTLLRGMASLILDNSFTNYDKTSL